MSSTSLSIADLAVGARAGCRCAKAESGTGSLDCGRSGAGCGCRGFFFGRWNVEDSAQRLDDADGMTVDVRLPKRPPEVTKAGELSTQATHGSSLGGEEHATRDVEGAQGGEGWRRHEDARQGPNALRPTVVGGKVVAGRAMHPLMIA